MARRASPEQTIQRAVFAHLRQRAMPGVFAFHCPNGGKRPLKEAAIFKGLGVVAGVPDVLAIKDGKLYGLELKAMNGRLTVTQDAVLRKMADAGAVVDAVRGLDAALIWLEHHGLLRRNASTPAPAAQAQLGGD